MNKLNFLVKLLYPLVNLALKSNILGAFRLKYIIKHLTWLNVFMGLLVLLLSIGFRYLLNIYLSDLSIEITAFLVGFNY